MTTSDADYKKFLKHLERNKRELKTFENFSQTSFYVELEDQRDVSTEILAVEPKEKPKGFFKRLGEYFK